MSQNRLKLDWALSTSAERTEFVNQYINQETFSKKPLSSEELETLANYVLWGKNDEGLNIEDEGLVEMPRRNSTWTSQELDSLDALIESPTFNESSIHSLNSKLPTKKTRQVFPRSEIRKKAPASLLPYYENLWRQIDETELLINFYEIRTGKRTKEPRDTLLAAFDENETTRLRERASKINQFTYLKLRHLLVELRREQYTTKDTFSEQILLRGSYFAEPESLSQQNFGLQVFPLGLTTEPNVGSLIFRDFLEVVPKNFSEEQLRLVSSFYWEKEKERKNIKENFFDFCEPGMVYEFFSQLEDFEEENLRRKDTYLKSFLDTLQYYTAAAGLSELQKEILDMKIKKIRNQDIATYINRKYGKTYTINYISTIFRQKIIPLICGAAEYHKKLIENLPFEEEFKVCTKCGRLLLRDPINFVRKSRSKDGLSNHCKDCDKEDREKRKKEIG